MKNGSFACIPEGWGSARFEELIGQKTTQQASKQEKEMTSPSFSPFPATVRHGFRKGRAGRQIPNKFDNIDHCCPRSGGWMIFMTSVFRSKCLVLHFSRNFVSIKMSLQNSLSHALFFPRRFLIFSSSTFRLLRNFALQNLLFFTYYFIFGFFRENLNIPFSGPYFRAVEVGNRTATVISWILVWRGVNLDDFGLERLVNDAPVRNGSGDETERVQTKDPVEL